MAANGILVRIQKDTRLITFYLCIWKSPIMDHCHLDGEETQNFVNGKVDVIGKVDVNGIHLLPSQVEFVSRMFEKHPEIASELRPKNPNLRTGYMNLLLSLIDSLRQKLPRDDMNEAYYALKSLTDAGFKLDWLEKKLDQVSEMKEREKEGEIRMQEIEKELKDLKQKCSDLEAQLEKEKSEALAAKAPISFDNII